MNDLDIIEENDNFRARLEYDDSADKPYDEGAVPILSREFGRYGNRFTAVNDEGEAFADLVTEAWNRLNRDDDVLARYLRIFYGAESVLWDSSSNYAYLAFDTAAWRTEHGLTYEWLDEHGMDRQTLAEGSLKEVMAWANGEVFGYIVERRVKTSMVRTDAVTGDVLGTVEGEAWEEVDSCWGFYGREYAEEVAKEAFGSYTK